MSEAVCPGCGTDSGGRFCAQCGVALEAECAVCANPLPRGARFCNHCGAPVSGPAAGERSVPARSSFLPWILAATFAVALLLVMLLPGWSDRGGTDATASGVAGATLRSPAAPAGNARAVDVASMPPREAAGRLFNRVMQAISDGDSAQAEAFLPMALAAYGRIDPLTIDDRYHVAMLEVAAEQPGAAAAQADTILAADADHLFGLAARAEAAQLEGRAVLARTTFQRFLDRYDAELRRGLPEYAEHATALRGTREEAEAYLAGAGAG